MSEGDAGKAPLAAENKSPSGSYAPGIQTGNITAGQNVAIEYKTELRLYTVGLRPIR